MSLQERKREKIAELEKKQKLGMVFGRALGKRRKSLWDRFLVKIAGRLAPPSDPAKSFMRDEICDAEPEFSPGELLAYRGDRDAAR